MFRFALWRDLNVNGDKIAHFVRDSHGQNKRKIFVVSKEVLEKQTVYTVYLSQKWASFIETIWLNFTLGSSVNQVMFLTLPSTK